jgi:hypothetical protein
MGAVHGPATTLGLFPQSAQGAGMSETNLRLYVGDLTSPQPLPARYLDISGILVMGVGSAGAHRCERCGSNWSAHSWMLTGWSAHSWMLTGEETIIDCSLRPRELPA